MDHVEQAFGRVLHHHDGVAIGVAAGLDVADVRADRLALGEVEVGPSAKRTGARSATLLDLHHLEQVVVVAHLLDQREVLVHPGEIMMPVRPRLRGALGSATCEARSKRPKRGAASTSSCIETGCRPLRI